MPFLQINRGFPASGKSTKTKQIVQDSHGKTVAVNRDYLRMMTGFKWWPANEELITDIEVATIKAAIARGLNVIVDDTFLKEKWVHKMRMLAGELCVEFVIDDSFLAVPLEQCIKRDAARERSVGKDVIERMYYDFWEQYPKPANNVGEECYIFDIDGTLALTPKGSSYYDRDYTLDLLNQPVLDMLYACAGTGSNSTAIVLVSGRNESAREGTELWLSKYAIPYTALYMRAIDDTRNDAVVKKELYHQHLEGKYIVRGVFDDRPRVVRMWRAELGFQVYHVASGVEF